MDKNNLRHGELKELSVNEEGELRFAFRLFDPRPEDYARKGINSYSYSVEEYLGRLYMFLTLGGLNGDQVYCLLIPAELEREVVHNLLKGSGKPNSVLN